MSLIPDENELLSLLMKRLCDNAPLLPKTNLHQFVEHFYSQKEAFLNLADRHNSPIYVFDRSLLEQRADRFRQAFSSVLPETAFYYAVKSNNYPGVSRSLMQAGFGLDVSSDQELNLALSIGSDDIVFSGPGKTDTELSLAADNSDRVVVLIDSFNELHRLQKIARDRDSKVRVGIRLSTSSSGLWQKFGIPVQELSRFCTAASTCTHLSLEGIQFHTSWNLNPEKQVLFIAELGTLLSGLPWPVQDSLRFIDIGGGYWPEHGEWLHLAGTDKGKVLKAANMQPNHENVHYCLPAQPIEYFAEELSKAIRRHLFSKKTYRICFEPGRWLCDHSMHLLLQVVDIKGEKIAITDGGTNAIGWERYEIDYCPILNLSRPALRERSSMIMGSLCTPHDLWGYGYWGEDIQPGDILLIPNQGAYTYSLRQEFIKAVPQVVEVNGLLRPFNNKNR